MVVASKTTFVVNAAFLQEIKDSNPDFYQAIDQLGRVCVSPDPPARLCRNLTRLLDSLRDQLALQFSLEESYGYMVVTNYPDELLCEAAGRAQAEHGVLYLQLTELAERAEELQYRGVETNKLRELVHEAREFQRQLRLHEQAEDELIERYFRLI